MNGDLYPENLIVGVRYEYTYHPSDWIPPPPNYNDNRRQSILTGKRFFYRNRDHQEINNIDEFNATINQFPVSVRLRFQNGDLLNIRRSQDEDERADGSWMRFINKYNFQECHNAHAAAAGGKRKKRKTKKQLIKLRNKKSKKRF